METVKVDINWVTWDGRLIAYTRNLSGPVQVGDVVLAKANLENTEFEAVVQSISSNMDNDTFTLTVDWDGVQNDEQ